MKREIVKISDSGAVTVPRGRILMTDFEIAELFWIMVPTVRGKIKTMLKSRMCVDCDGGIVSGNRMIPEYFGLEVIISIAMQVDSYKARVFRECVMNKLTRPTAPPIYIQMKNDSTDSIFS
ncbi:MAG: hypothetical protein SNI70_06890 [Rikenellaceae bacterium]